jgi:hypothetical protein
LPTIHTNTFLQVTYYRHGDWHKHYHNGKANYCGPFYPIIVDLILIVLGLQIGIQIYGQLS